MSQKYCWQCGNSYANDEVFDIPIFSKGYTLNWCLNCAMDQLGWTDYRLVEKPSKYKKFRIRSQQDKHKEWEFFLEELQLSYETQFRKIKVVDSVWGELQSITGEEVYDNSKEGL